MPVNTDTDERLDISDLVDALCSRAAVLKEDCCLIVIDPGELTIKLTVFETNEEGNKYYDPATGTVPQREVKLKVRT